jgi:hypothetical protein
LTVKPSLCLYVLETEPQLGDITFLDADLMLSADFALLASEMDQYSIMVVPQRFPAEHQWIEDMTGVYNAGTVGFRRDRFGLSALRWWRDRCLEWCFSQPDEGRWTDQRYLNDWSQRFDGVRIIEHPGAGLAPWNANRYNLSVTDDGTLVSGQPLIFYHYQGLVLYRHLTVLRRLGLFAKSYRLLDGPNPWVWNASNVNAVSDSEAQLLWNPYLRRLRAAVEELRRFDPSVAMTSASGLADYFRPRLTRLRRGLGLTRRTANRFKRLAHRTPHASS